LHRCPACRIPYQRYHKGGLLRAVGGTHERLLLAKPRRLTDVRHHGAAVTSWLQFLDFTPVHTALAKFTPVQVAEDTRNRVRRGFRCIGVESNALQRQSKFHLRNAGVACSSHADGTSSCTGDGVSVSSRDQKPAIPVDDTRNYRRQR
jgi:hypothetical protein